MRSGVSSESFVSAVMSHEDLMDFDEVDGPQTVKPLVPPGLLSAYGHHLHLMTCMNWRQNLPSALRRKFSLMKNVKARNLFLFWLDL